MEKPTRSFLAPAKINLCLHVLGRRPDGYHDLAMIMQPISLYDRLEITLSPDPGVRVTCSGVELLPGEENIAARAARRLLDRCGGTAGVDICIEKNIPVAAGLGGGSSDAATVLMGLNDMLQLGLDRRELMAEGGRLGADVPFFIFSRTAWATGIGEVLEPFDVPLPLWYVLVNPGIAVSTAWVYGNLELTAPGGMAKMPGFPKSAAEVAGFLHNDLERVTVRHHPVLAEIKERLLSQGAFGALMSGSGPTVFGAFQGETEAKKAAESFADENGWRTLVVQPI
jgi:4-diphosphocytidyl-2-C-methyl-D-erythritol kinase